MHQHMQQAHSAYCDHAACGPARSDSSWTTSGRQNRRGLSTAAYSVQRSSPLLGPQSQSRGQQFNGAPEQAEATQQTPQLHLLPALKTMARLMISLNRDLQVLKREDSFRSFSTATTHPAHFRSWWKQPRSGTSTPPNLHQHRWRCRWDKSWCKHCRANSWTGSSSWSTPRRAHLCWRLQFRTWFCCRTEHSLIWNGAFCRNSSEWLRGPRFVGQDASTLHRADGHDERPLAHTALPLTPGQTTKCGNAMETPNEHEIGQTLGADDEAGPGQRVDFDGYELAAKQPPGSPIGGNAQSDQPEGEGQRTWEGQSQTTDDAAGHQSGNELTRQDMLLIVSHMVLENRSNWCLANSTTYSLLWCMFGLSCFEPHFWGEQRNALLTFLEKMKIQHGNISGELFFQEVLHCWGRCDLAALTRSISQQDAAEYVQHWLQMMNAEAFDHTWEKHFVDTDEVLVMDCSTRHMPLGFHFEEPFLNLIYCDLTTLARMWHQVDGMNTCLLRTSPCMCVCVCPSGSMYGWRRW